MREPKANSGLNSAWKLVGATLVALSVAAAVFVCIPQRHAASDELWVETGANEVPPIGDVILGPIDFQPEYTGGGLLDGEMFKTPTTTTTETPAVTSEYRVVKEAKNWFEADDYCKSLGMELAAVRNAEDNSRIQDELTDEGIDDAWIGLSGMCGLWHWPDIGLPELECRETSGPSLDHVHNDGDYITELQQKFAGVVNSAIIEEWIRNKYTGDWMWADGNELNYDNWAPDEPSNSNNKHCAQMNEYRGQWLENACDVSLDGFVCESIPTLK